MTKNKVAITLGIMCLILTAAVGIQIRTIESTSSTVKQTLKDDNLRDAVLKWKEKYDNKYRELEQSTQQLEKERQKSTSTDATSIEKQEELKKINAYLGLSKVEGQGLIITLKDNVTSKIGTAEDVVHDGDLREIVNELKNAGAEAISINDQRITPSTAITCIGTVILVNDEKVGAPFIIKAIGNQERLWGAITRPGGYADILETYLTVDIKREDKILIEKYNGVLTNQTLKNEE